MNTLRSKQANSAIIGIYHLLLTVSILAALYFGQEIIIPLALASLLIFLLAPLASRVERWIGRVPSVLMIVLVIFILASMIAHTLSMELMDLSSKLPTYKQNITTKMQSADMLNNGFFTTVFHRIENLPQYVAPEKVLESTSVTQTAQSVLSSLLHLTVNIGFVLILVIFMLINREDLKARIVRLIGQGNISSTNRAIDDAATRISQYLLMQLIVNCIFGTTLAIGLFFIGIPNYILWGSVLIVLRFIPYVGTWISAFIPVLLSFLISDSWLTPIFTISLYLILDLLSTNFLEPWIYGSTTGISSTALIIAAVFWTLLWGPVGLLLAIPLTVCLVVIGEHVPQLEFLYILLGNEKALAVHEECYRRLLTENTYVDMDFIDTYLKDNSLIKFYDAVLIPLLITVGKELKSEALEPEKEELLYQNIHEIIEEKVPEIVDENFVKENTSNKNIHILCIPSFSLREELASEMLARAIKQNLFDVKSINLDNVSQIKDSISNEIDIICILVVSPSTSAVARRISKNIRSNGYNNKIFVALLGENSVEIDVKEKIISAGANNVVTSLEECLSEIYKLKTSQ
jgi:predicted PurR-regulated permease PerM